MFQQMGISNQEAHFCRIIWDYLQNLLRNEKRRSPFSSFVFTFIFFFFGNCKKRKGDLFFVLKMKMKSIFIRHFVVLFCYHYFFSCLFFFPLFSQMSFFSKKSKSEVSASGEAVQKVDGVFFSFNKKTQTLVVDGADQELEVMSLPPKIGSLCASAVTVDLSGNSLVTLEGWESAENFFWWWFKICVFPGFEDLDRCETLFLDNNQLREDVIVLSGGAVLSVSIAFCFFVLIRGF